MKIIAFAGMPFSGKSEAVKIAKEQNIPVIRMGDMVWEETKNKGFEINDENVEYVANNMREEYGKDIWAQRTIDKIKTIEPAKILVIDGIRNIEEIEFFKSKLGDDFLLIAVDVPKNIRYKRAMSRGREDDSLDIEKIKKRDERELGWGLDTVIESADIVISNEDSIEEFRKRIEDVFYSL
jgi:dephospho-CoA kinase